MAGRVGMRSVDTRLFRSARRLAATLLLCTAGACARIAAEPLPAGCITPTPAQIGGPISLLDETGAPITQAAFQGRPAIVYFGYTFCPDVCPLSMQSLALTLGELGESGRPIQPILISVDPERDTPAAVQRYVQSGGFPAGLRGLTGSPAQVKAAAAAFKVGYRKDSTERDYTVSHLSSFFVIDPDWRVRGLMPASLAPKEAAACIAAALQHRS